MRDSIYAKLNRYFENKKEYGAFFLRVIIGWRLVDGTQDNVFSWARMLEFRDFLEQFHVPYPLLSAQVSVYAQFICGILYVIGLWIRPAAMIMIINFIVALFIVHIGTTFQVIHAAKAFTSSRFTCGSNRIPPFEGPRIVE